MVRCVIDDTDEWGSRKPRISRAAIQGSPSPIHHSEQAGWGTSDLSRAPTAPYVRTSSLQSNSQTRSFIPFFLFNGKFIQASLLSDSETTHKWFASMYFFSLIAYLTRQYR